MPLNLNTLKKLHRTGTKIVELVFESREVKALSTLLRIYINPHISKTLLSLKKALAWNLLIIMKTPYLYNVHDTDVEAGVVPRNS